jgi:glycosyltransferase involved in cell wall biosynthesis
MDPIVTIITPHFDCAHHLHEAIASILGQTHASLELYLVDDSSPDERWLEVVRRFDVDPRLHVFRTSQNVGPWRIVNRVIRMTAAPFIGFQDADDRSDPDRLRKLIAAADRTGADVVGSAARYIDVEGKILSVKRFPRYASLHLALGRRFVMLHPTTLVRRASLERIGLFDGTRRFAADMEFILRAHRRRLRLRNIREPLYDYRRRPQSLTMSAGTGHGWPDRESYIDAVFARRAADHVTPGESDVAFEMTPVYATTRRS